MPNPSAPGRRRSHSSFGYRLDMHLVPQDMLSEHPPNNIPEDTIRARIEWIKTELKAKGMKAVTEFSINPFRLRALRELLAKGQCTGDMTPAMRTWIVYRVDASLDEPRKPQHAHIGVITPQFSKEYHRLRYQPPSSGKSCHIYKGIETIFAAAKEADFPLSDTYAITAGVFVRGHHPMLNPLDPDPVLKYAALITQCLRSAMMIDSSALVTVKAPSRNNRYPVIPNYGHPAYIARHWFYLVAGVYKGAAVRSSNRQKMIEDLGKTWLTASNDKAIAWKTIRRCLNKHFRRGNIRQTDLAFWDERWEEFGEDYCEMDKRLSWQQMNEETDTYAWENEE